jgi:hypothetical protein
MADVLSPPSRLRGSTRREGSLYFQKWLKGIVGLDASQVQEMLDARGITCRWWHSQPDGLISPPQIVERLTHENLMSHLNNYSSFGAESPFISTTAGAIHRVATLGNFPIPAIYTAVQFATDGFTSDGWVFYGWSYTLGRPAVPLQEFAEEVRELHQYSEYLPFHREGEIVEKVHIPSTRLRLAQPWTVTGGALSTGPPLIGSSYQAPEDYVNVRGVI